MTLDSIRDDNRFRVEGQGISFDSLVNRDGVISKFWFTSQKKYATL
ncbi:hypothetical protein HYR99_33660 [Candidatus Poribacteria bacterium]|nr:hypothetical protein [Candidatus Poribacteria bacterium]